MFIILVRILFIFRIGSRIHTNINVIRSVIIRRTFGLETTCGIKLLSTNIINRASIYKENHIHYIESFKIIVPSLFDDFNKGTQTSQRMTTEIVERKNIRYLPSHIIIVYSEKFKERKQIVYKDLNGK